MAKRLIANPEKAPDVLTREELGLNPEELGSPISAAISSFLTFCVGACVPLIPFLLGNAKDGIWIAAILVGIALFGVGSALSLISGKNALLGGARMLAVASVAAAATYFIGTFFWGDYRVMHGARCVEPAGGLLQSGTRPGPRIGGSRT